MSTNYSQSKKNYKNELPRSVITLREAHPSVFIILAKATELASSSLGLRQYIFLFSILYIIFSISPVFALTSVNTSNKNVVTNGLVGHWTFDGKDTTWTSSTTGTTNSVVPSSFPTVVSSVAFNADASFDTQQTITLPSSVMAGNLLVLILRAYSGDLTPSAGWTTLSTSTVGGGHYSGIYYRIADGSEGSTTTFTTGGNANTSGIGYQISGFSGIKASYAATNTVDPPSLTPSWGKAKTLWISFIDAARSDWNITSTPTNYTNSLIATTGNGSTAVESVSTASRNLDATSDNPSTFATNGGSPDTPRAGLIAIAPAVLPITGTLTWMRRNIAPTGGKIGQALMFDTENLVGMGSPSTLDNINNFSYSVWVNVLGSTDNGSQQRIMVKDIFGSDFNGAFLQYNQGISYENHAFHALVGFSATNSVAISQNLWNVTGGGNSYRGGWKHVVATFDGTSKQIKLYINGVEANYQTNTTGVGTRSDDSAGSFYVGNSLYGTRAFNGKIDDTRVYNRVLTAKEIQSLYKAGGGVTQASVSNTKANTNSVGISNGLVSHWTFDGKNMTNATATDISGNNNNGTLTNMTTASSKVGGKLGQGMIFNGTTSIIKVGTSPSLINDYSFSLWFKKASTTSDGQIISNYNGYGSQATYIRLSKYFTSFYFNGGLVEIPPILNTNWHHIICSRNSSTGEVKMYIDGTLATSTISTIGVADYGFNNRLAIGGSDNIPLNQPSGVFLGTLDDVRVYNRVLSTKEIQSLYKLGQTKTAVTQTTNSNISNNLVSHWTFDGKDMDWSSATAEVRNKVDSTNHANYINPSMSYVRPGKLGQALYFDGTTTRLQSVKSPLLAIEPNGFSQTLWVKRTATGTDSYITEMGGSDGFTIFYDTTPHRFGCRIRDNASHMPEVYQSGGTPVLNKWYFVACVYDPNSDTLKIYINDSVNSTDASTFDGTFISGVAGINIGARGYSSDYHTGLIDDIRFYNRALSEKEIQSIYKLGSP